MSITSAYWVPPPDQDFKIQTTNTKPNDLGFRTDIPWPLPVAPHGGRYYGEGREHLDLRKELNTSVQGEYFARGGQVIPSTGGIPLVNIYDPIYKFSRDRTAVAFKE
jgi:hypothetical protein